jgi:DNA end-binding protein Ku
MKAVWEGSIVFGLVDIPIKLYSATEPRTIRFKYLCGKCNTPLQYKRYCVKCKKEVPWEEVAYGFEISKGKFKIFSREELEKIKPEKSDVAEVIAFLNLSAIDPIFFQKSYYAVPTKKKEKPFFLFMEALRSKARAGIVKIIMRNKEYIATITPYKNVLLLTTLLYTSEIRKLERFEELKDRPKISSEELNLANKLIDKYSKRELDMTQYRDEFAEKLKEIIKGKKPKPVKVQPKPEKLIEALKLSIKK